MHLLSSCDDIELTNWTDARYGNEDGHDAAMVQ